MSMSPYQANALLSKGVCEIVFDRRHIRQDSPNFRRALATCCWPILYSEEGKKILNFVQPTHLPSYFPPDYNLVLYWDILCGWWRCADCSTLEIRRMIPANEWWGFFDEFIRPMDAQSKIAFMKN
jgi:hypothetical protein